jgi:hypothetical protein
MSPIQYQAHYYQIKYILPNLQLASANLFYYYQHFL